MSAIQSHFVENRFPRALRCCARFASRGALPGAALAMILACGSNNSGSASNSGGNNSPGSNSTAGNNGSGGSTTGGNNSSGGNNGSGGNSSNGGNNGSGGNGSNGGNNGSGSSGTSNGSGGSSTSSGARTGNADAGETGDASVACTNTNTSAINIDSSGWVCNNKWGIQGAWYCYADTAGTSNCTGTGDVPFNSTQNAMCISGTTSTSTNASTAFGAGLGLVLNAPAHGSTVKNAFNAPAQNIVGFAITISGTTGGSVLNINLPPSLTSAGESPAVTVPGVDGTSMTYNVLIADAIISDNTTAPVPIIKPADLTDVQVAIPGADGVAHQYNYCITNIVPLTSAPTAPGALAAYGPSFDEGKQIVIESLGPLAVQNDIFTVGNQMQMSVSYGGGQAGFTATPMFSSGSVAAFPSIVSGWVTGGNLVSQAEGGYAGNKTVGTGGTLSTATSSWTWSAGSGNWDAAYDCWLAANPNPIKAGSELMIWLGHENVGPIGGQNQAVTISGVPGSWTVSTGTNPTGQPVVSYVSSTNMTSVSGFDLKPFFDDAAANNRASISNGTVLLSVQAGFELYNQGTWTTSSYSIDLQ